MLKSSCSSGLKKHEKSCKAVKRKEPIENVVMTNKEIIEMFADVNCTVTDFNFILKKFK